MFQTLNLIPYLTALEKVKVSLALQWLSKSTQRPRSVALLEQVDLDDRLSHKPGELSTGQQQHVALARTLGNNPSLILADELTGNLDLQSRESALSMFDGFFRDGRTIVIVTHDLDAAARAGRRLALIDGRIFTSVGHRLQEAA